MRTSSYEIIFNKKQMFIISKFSKLHVFPYNLTKLQTPVEKVDSWCFVDFPILKRFALLNIICFVSLLELKQQVKLFLTRYTPSLVERVYYRLVTVRNAHPLPLMGLSRC